MTDDFVLTFDEIWHDSPLGRPKLSKSLRQPGSQ